MSKRKRRTRRAKKKKGTQKARQATVKKSWKRKLFYRAWKYFVAIGVIVGVIGFLYSMSSRISVVCQQPLNPNEPFTSPFEIQNQGYLPIYNVEFFCGIRQTKTSTGSQVSNIRTRIKRPLIPIIKAGENSTTFCTVFWYKTTVYADITVEIKYRPKFLLWKKEKHFRFITRKDAKGHFVWLPRALSE